MKCWGALLTGLALGVIIHVLWWDKSWEALVYVGLPGMMAHILVTGGHGGTMRQERIGSILEVLTNAGAYSVLLFIAQRIAGKIWGRAQSNEDGAQRAA